MGPQGHSFLGSSEMENMKLLLLWRNKRTWRHFRPTVWTWGRNNGKVRNCERQRWGPPTKSTSGGGVWRPLRKRGREEENKLKNRSKDVSSPDLNHVMRRSSAWKWLRESFLDSSYLEGWINDWMCYDHILIEGQKDNDNQKNSNITHCLLNLSQGYLFFLITWIVAHRS